MVLVNNTVSQTSTPASPDRYDEHDRRGGGRDGGSPAPPVAAVAPVIAGSGLGSGEGA